MPRLLAVQALERFRRAGSWSEETLNALLRQRPLAERDAALGSRIFYGVLQQLYRLDFWLDEFAAGRLEPKVRDILRVGLYQIVFLDRVPDRAAVSESVALCRALGYERACGLVNAVLRRCAREKSALPRPAYDEDSAEYLCIWYSHPLPLVQELIGTVGVPAARSILEANNGPAPVYLQTNTLRISPAELAARLGAREHPTLPGCLRADTLRVAQDEAFSEGLYFVQDPAARLAVSLAELRPGMKVLDACAAPGGKSFAAALEMQNRGEILARDLHPRKLSLVDKGARRMGFDCIRCRAGDARETPAEGELYDVVMADVPCSGLGVIRKKPDIRYRPWETLSALPALQLSIAGALSRCVRPGGVLLYSTCTWRESENRAVVDALLETDDTLCFEYERTFRTDWDDTDGFYVCRLRKKT